MLYEPLKIEFSTPVNQMNNEQLKDYANWFATVLPERVKMLAAEIQSTPAYLKWNPDFSIASLDDLGRWFYEKIRDLPLRYKSREEIQESLQNWFFNNVIPEVHGITPSAIFDQFQSWRVNALGSNLDPEQAANLAMEWFYQHIGPKDANEKSEDFLAFESQWLSLTHGQILDPICMSIFADVGMYFSQVFAKYLKKNYPHIKWHRSFGSLKYRHYYPHAHVLETNELMVNFDPISAMTNIGFDICEGKGEANAVKDLFIHWADCMAIYNRQLPILEELTEAGICVKSLWDFRYEENLNQRKVFSQAIPILCKHLKEQEDPYILEAIVAGLLEDELKNELVASIALEVLETRSSTLPTSVQRFLVLLAMQEESLTPKANQYLT